MVVNPSTYPANGPWLRDSASLASQWIGPIENFDSRSYPGSAGNYDYVLTVTAEAGDTVSGRWASDNTSNILLNAVSTSNSITSRTSSDFNSWHPFTITGFGLGTNTITFRVNNESDGPTGLRVEFVTPEPAGLFLVGAALAGAGLVARRRKSQG